MKNNIISMTIILFLIVVISYQYKLETNSFIPVSINQNEEDNPIKRKLDYIGVASNAGLISAICFASEQNDISPELIIALAWTESNFKSGALSFGNGGKYKGIMQIPQAVFYADANILIGTKILKEKLSITNGDMTKALLLYKGYPLDSPRGHEQVRKVFALYQKLKTVV